MTKQNLPFKVTIHGRPVILKNGKQICFNKQTGRRFVKSNSRVVAWMDFAQTVMREAFRGRETITCLVNAKMTFYGAWKKEGSTVPDLSNLYQAPEDALQKAGVILDDVLIESHDCSRRIRMCEACEDRPFYKAGPKKGTRKPDCGAVKSCPYQKVVIELTEFVE